MRRVCTDTSVQYERTVRLSRPGTSVSPWFKELELDTGEKTVAGVTDVETGELDAEDVFCSKCGDDGSDDHNDILLCDGFCERCGLTVCS